jgi:hypothetical protein
MNEFFIGKIYHGLEHTWRLSQVLQHFFDPSAFASCWLQKTSDQQSAKVSLKFERLSVAVSMARRSLAIHVSVERSMLLPKSPSLLLSPNCFFVFVF